jgi:hypothetical protein
MRSPITPSAMAILGDGPSEKPLMETFANIGRSRNALHRKPALRTYADTWIEMHRSIRIDRFGLQRQAV